MVIDPVQLSSVLSDVPAAGVCPFSVKVKHSFTFLLSLFSLLFINLLALTVQAQIQARAQPDSIYEFRFVSHKEMFYVPWQGNDTQLDNLLSLVETHKSAILSGEAPLLVDGYCASEPTVAENLKLAKTRSNRVKSELILSKGVTESSFITHNHAEPYGDLRHVGIVRLHLPKPEPPLRDVESISRSALLSRQARQRLPGRYVPHR